MATRPHKRRPATKPKDGRSHRHEAKSVPEHAGGARPIWTGTISFALVAVPVQMFPAVRSSEPALRMLGPDGAPLQRRYVSAEGKQVPTRQLSRGFEVGAGRHVVLTDEELAAAAPRKSRDIDLRRFVPAHAVDPVLFERPYVLTPAGESAKAYRLLAAVMERDEKIGIATFVMRTKEYLVAVVARRGVLWVETMRFHDEIHRPGAVGAVVKTKPSAQAVAAMQRAIVALERKSISRDQLVASRGQQLAELARKKFAKGQDVVEAPSDGSVPIESTPETAVADAPDLVEAIRRGLRMVTDDAVRPSSRRHAGRHSAPAARRRTPAKGRRRPRAVAAR